MTVDFNDIEEDDVFDADPTIDPLQVGIRLHELRIRLDEFAGRRSEEYWELSEDEQTLVRALGQAIVDQFEYDPSVEALAEHVHGVRRYIAMLGGDDSIPEWDSLGDDDRDLVVALLTEIVEWLEREGPR